MQDAAHGSNKLTKFSHSDGSEGSVTFQEHLKATCLPGGQTQITKFLLPPDIAEKFVDLQCRLMYESCGSVPLSLLELPRMKEMFNLLGIKRPSRTWVSNTKLDRVYNEAKSEIVNLLESNGGYFQLASDGWRSKYVENSEKLLNFLALLPDGGAVFLGIERTKGEVLDTDALADFLMNGALKAVEGADIEAKQQLRERMLGVVMDGEAVNHSALRKLRTDLKHPALMGVVCVAHALNLLVKDIVEKVPVIHTVVKKAKQIAVHFCEKPVAKRLLKEAQFDLNKGKVKPLRLPPDTRFAYVVRMLSDVIENQRVFKWAANDPEYEEAFDTDDGWILRDIIGNNDFWLAAQAAYKLLEPMAQAIYNIESDR